MLGAEGQHPSWGSEGTGSKEQRSASSGHGVSFEFLRKWLSGLSKEIWTHGKWETFTSTEQIPVITSLLLLCISGSVLNSDAVLLALFPAWMGPCPWVSGGESSSLDRPRHRYSPGFLKASTGEFLLCWDRAKRKQPKSGSTGGTIWNCQQSASFDLQKTALLHCSNTNAAFETKIVTEPNLWCHPVVRASKWRLFH